MVVNVSIECSLKKSKTKISKVVAIRDECEPG